MVSCSHEQSNLLQTSHTQIFKQDLKWLTMMEEKKRGTWVNPKYQENNIKSPLRARIFRMPNGSPKKMMNTM